MLASDWLMTNFYPIRHEEKALKGSNIDLYRSLDKFSRPNLLKGSVQNRALSEILVLHFGDSSEIRFVYQYVLLQKILYFAKFIFENTDLFVVCGGF